MKAFFQVVVDRVWKSYKSTLVGLGIGAALIVADQVVAAASGTDNVWLKVAAALAAVVGASLRSKALPPPAP